MFHQSSKQILLGIFVALLLITVPAYAVKNYKFSNYAGGHQIWFEVEDYDERDPDTDEYFPVVNESGAFGKAINRTGVAGGMIRWTFDISKAGGKGGTWYFWGRVINPNGSSDFMIVEGHPGDPTLPAAPPYPGTPTAPGFNDTDRLFYQDAGPPWTWSRADHVEAHTKQLQDGENTMYIIHRRGNNTVFWDVFMWTDNPDYVPTDADYRNAERPSAGAATNPGPANEATEGIGGVTQSAASYAVPQRLDFNKTYYWRVDEVNGPPDFTVYKGDVWQFTVEPFAYPIENIIATASSQFSEDTGPQKTIDGSGLDENDLHSIEETGVWLSSITGAQPTWIQYEFDRVYKLHQMWIWNHNTSVEPVFGFGIKDATIEYSVDGANWTTLGTTHEFARAPGAAGYAANTTLGLSGAVAKYVKITANSNWGGIVPQYSLSEVRFFYIPIRAREPSPDSEATDVYPDVVLSWRAGREAAEHDVYLSTDEQAVIDGTAPVTIVTEASHGPLSLDLGQTYYWKINEVNMAETPNTLEGNLWDFTTAVFLVVDDFESYNDLDPTEPESNRIFNVWIDGYEVPTNGSLVGYDDPPFCEQSMPFFYANTGGATYSEAERTFAVGQDWTKYGIKTLSLWFYGDPTNAAERMYVKVNGAKVVYGGNVIDIQSASWHEWNIELASFGVDLQNVTNLAIGIDGNGASGTLYLDDIRLYRSAPETQAN
ncbi:MAG: discoidin domain-containing protein [Planctomycetota bacterium]|jgi:hypothetical protein